MTDETYNGWTNRETWAVSLYVENDHSMYADRQQLLSEWTEDTDVATAAREWFEGVIDSWDEIAEDSPEGTRFLLNMLRDIGSLWRVNWQELGTTWIDDYEI